MAFFLLFEFSDFIGKNFIHRVMYGNSYNIWDMFVNLNPLPDLQIYQVKLISKL